MNQQLRNGVDAFLQRYQGLRARLPGNPALRDAAAERFAADGLPGTKGEAWRYTSLRGLAETAFQEPLVAVSSDPNLGDGIPGPRLVLVDGRYQPGLSVLPDGVTVTTFADHPDFGRLPRLDAPMVALNTMLAEDGVQLHVAAGVDAGTVELVSVAVDGHRPVAFHPRHSIHLDTGAKLTVVEVTRGAGAYLHNAVTEAVVADDAALVHIRLQQEGDAAYHVNTTFVEIASRGVYDAFVLTLGAKLARTEIHARLLGEGGAVHLNGAQLLGGHQHGDITTIVAHDAPACASRQTVKNVLSDHARGVFQGRIEVARVAQKTDGYQMNQALLLSPHAEINCKPQLEIYADDVKCSHGATVGELDVDQLFYLRSRGIPESEARAILVRSFLSEAMDPIQHEGARALLERAIEQWWERRPA